MNKYTVYEYDEVTKAFLTSAERYREHQQFQDWTIYIDELLKFGEGKQ